MSPASSTISSPKPPVVDTRYMKFSQVSVMVLSGLAFVLNIPWLVVFVAVLLSLSAAWPSYSPFRVVYRSILVPAKLLAPRIVEDDPDPHRFAQGVGAVFTIASAFFLLIIPVYGLGWTLDIIVFILSGLNFFVGFCAGCFVYYQLGRIGLMPKVRYDGAFHWRGV